MAGAATTARGELGLACYSAESHERAASEDHTVAPLLPAKQTSATRSSVAKLGKAGMLVLPRPPLRHRRRTTAAGGLEWRPDATAPGRAVATQQ